MLPISLYDSVSSVGDFESCKHYIFADVFAVNCTLFALIRDLQTHRGGGIGGDLGELTHFSLKTIFCQNGTSLLNYIGMLVFHAISHVTYLKTPKTITVFT